MPGKVCHAKLFPTTSPLTQMREELTRPEQPSVTPQEAPVQHPSYVIKKDHYLQEYNMRAVEYQHKSGATLWSLEAPNTETEMTFSICFSTPVEDSYGTPHILEHSVLMGSESYPVPSIFKVLMSSSLNTYLNAATWPDHTCYHFASLNNRDFYNILKVYLDAVFRPLLLREPLVFRQEGWHYELSVKKDLKVDGDEIDCVAKREMCDLKYSGVVFNEMKGSLGNPENLEELYRLKELFPEVQTYVETAGGVPEFIPGISHHHLKEFHRRFYTPGNSWLVFYGPDDVETRLKTVDDYISTSIPPQTQPKVTIGNQTVLTAPKFAEYPYPSPTSELKDIVTVSWVLNPCTANGYCEEFDANRRVELKILEYLLTGTEQSPLYKALNDSQLGMAVYITGLDFEAKHAVYSVGLREVKHQEGVAAEIEAVVEQSMASLESSGFREEEVVAAINSVEFTLRECRRGSVPRGLKFARLMAEQINFGRDPLTSLLFIDPLRQLRERIVSGERVFENLLKRYFLENPHRLTLRLKANTTISADAAADERRRLEETKASMTHEELAKIVEEQQALSEMQVAAPSLEALATIPKLRREDIDPNGQEIPLEVTSVAKVPLLTHELPSSGLVYVDVGVSLADLSLDDLSYLPLLTGMIGEAGTSELPASVLLPLRGQTLGGVAASFTFRAVAEKPLTIADPYSSRGLLLLSGKATEIHAVDLWCLLHVMLVDTNFSDGKTGVQLIKKLISGREKSFYDWALVAALRLARSSFGVSEFVEEVTRGYRSLLFYRQLLAQAEADWDSVAARLSRIRARLLTRRNLVLNVTGDRSSLMSATTGVAREALLGLIEALPDNHHDPASFTGESGLGSEALDREPLWVRTIRESNLLNSAHAAYTTAAQVSDVALVTPFSPPGSPFLGSDLVATSRIELLYLFTQVRELSGAYGALLKYSRSGLIAFGSYRDPKVATTLRTFRSSPMFLEAWANAADEQALLEAIFPVLSDLDFPMDVDKKGIVSLWQFIGRETKEDRSTLRSQVLQTTPVELLQFATRLRDALEAKVEAVTLIGPESAAKEVIEDGEQLKLVEVA